MHGEVLLARRMAERKESGAPPLAKERAQEGLSHYECDTRIERPRAPVNPRPTFYPSHFLAVHFKSLVMRRVKRKVSQLSCAPEKARNEGRTSLGTGPKGKACVSFYSPMKVMFPRKWCRSRSRGHCVIQHKKHHLASRARKEAATRCPLWEDGMTHRTTGRRARHVRCRLTMTG